MSEAILLPQFPKEIDLSAYALASHSHSGYASSSHSHSGYASSSHSHTLSSLGIDESKLTINKTETYNILGTAFVSASSLPTSRGYYVVLCRDDANWLNVMGYGVGVDWNKYPTPEGQRIIGWAKVA